MASEALRNIRTMRQVKTSLAVAASKKVKTASRLTRTGQEIESLESTGGRQTGQILAKERARFAAYDASVEKSRQRLLKSRERLAAIIGQNLRLTELRHELQEARWRSQEEGLPPAPPAKPAIPGDARLRQIEFKY
jgi:hypothetical protein